MGYAYADRHSGRGLAIELLPVNKPRRNMAVPTRDDGCLARSLCHPSRSSEACSRLPEATLWFTTAASLHAADSMVTLFGGICPPRLHLARHQVRRGHAPRVQEDRSGERVVPSGSSGLAYRPRFRWDPARASMRSCAGRRCCHLHCRDSRPPSLVARRGWPESSIRAGYLSAGSGPPVSRLRGDPRRRPARGPSRRKSWLF